MNPPEVIVIPGHDHRFIPVNYVASLLTDMAAADGVITPHERKILKEFAEMFGLNTKELYEAAKNKATDIELQEVLRFSTSRMKGLKFEQFIVNLLSKSQGFSLISWRSDKTVNHTYAQDALLPDLEVRLETPDAIANIMIECKFRSTWDDSGIDISDQIKRYRNAATEKGCSLYIALGIGGRPYKPDKIYLIPDDHIPSDGILRADQLANCHCRKSPSALSARLLANP